MTATATSTRLKLPSDRDIAFAAAVIRSKPDKLSIPEYLSLIRQHIAKGRRENALSTVYRHLDRSAFWRTECERANASLQAAQDRETDALKEVELLRSRIEVMKASPSKKRRADPDVVLYPRSPKKERRTVSPARGIGEGNVLDDEIALEATGENAHELMRCLFRLEACLKPGVKVDIANIAHQVVSAAAQVPPVVLAAVQSQCRAEDSDTNTLKATLTAAARVGASLLVGYTRLCKHDEQSTLQGQATFAMVQMFDQCLRTLQAASETRTAPALGPIMTAGASTAPPTKQNSPQKSTPRVQIKDDPILNAITSFLVTLLKHLDIKHDSHKALYEGYFFTIISALGARLHTIVFNQPRSTTLSEDILAPIPDPDLPADSLPLKRAKLEAPYLLHLLKHALALAPTFFGKLAKGGKPSTKPGVASKNSIALLAKERLQRTLVNAIFGTEGVGEESDMLTECLRMPVFNSVAAMTAPRVKEAEVGEWFKEEVWRLLGWEVLGKELDV